MFSYPTEENPMYSHSETFGNTTIPTDIKAINFFSLLICYYPQYRM